MVPKLYGTITSPPVRAILMCAKAIELELDFVEVNILKMEHMKPEFIKLNPLHTVPVLDDNNGFILVDSHAIMAYLVESYAKDKSLYPAEVKKHARINQILHFDSGTLFARHLRTAIPVLMGDIEGVSEENEKSINEAYGFVETFLQTNKYIAGDSLSIADFSVLTSISNACACVPLDEDRYPKITSWRKTLERLPYYKINSEGSERYHRLVEAALAYPAA